MSNANVSVIKNIFKRRCRLVIPSKMSTGIRQVCAGTWIRYLVKLGSGLEHDLEVADLTLAPLVIRYKHEYSRGTGIDTQEATWMSTRTGR